MSQSLLGTPATQLETLPSASSTSRPAAQPIALESNAQQPPQSVAFVDTRLAQVDQLVAGMEADKVVLIDSQADGVEQITQTLSQYDSLSSVHIFSHGNPGSLQLGNRSLDSDSIDQYSAQLSQWGSALLGKADLMLYGCDLTGSESGLSLVQQISDLTGADVAASEDTTGASDLGGDWQLETHIGEIESAIALNQATQAAYASTLDLIANGNFEADLASWNLFTGTETATAAGALNGKSLSITAAGGGVGQIVPATPGEAYKITGFAKSSATSGYSGTGIDFLDADRNQIRGIGTSRLNNTTDWTPYELQGTADADTAFIQVWAYKEDAGGVLSLDNIELTTTTIEPPPGPGEELLTNPGFENGLAAWNGISGTEAISTTANTGSQSLQLSGAASGANQLVDAIAGEEYTLSLFGRTQSPNYVGAGLSFFDANYNPLSASSSNNIQVSGDSWTSYQTSITAPSQTEFVQVWTYQSQANGDSFLDDISLSTTVEPTDGDFGNIGLDASNITVNESDGTATLTVLRTDGSDGTITVDYGILAQSATAGEDFTPVSGTLTFAEGETEKTVDVAILEDNVAEGSESFGFAIDNVQGGATLLAPRTATVTITDNDSAVYRGNEYQLIAAQSWEEAQAAAETLGGNLVTINAAAEEAFLKQTFGTAEAFWIGINDSDTEGTFEWASGESVVYTNWAPGEPNDFGSGQDYGYLNATSSKQWDDSSGDARFKGIVEIGGDNGSDDVTPGTGNGLVGEYYNNADFTSPVLTRTDTTVNFDWDNGSPDPSIGVDTFSVRWTGRIEPLYSETYTFQTTSDDGVRLFVNDQLIIDKFIDQGPTAHTGTIQLEAGEQYDIRMEYYEQGGGAVAQLAWSSASQPFQVVPQSQLYSDPPQDEVLVTESLITGLTQPTSIEWQPNTNRMFISEKGGVVKIFENGSVNADPFIDISDQVNGRRDRGLLDIAIHPDFPSTPYVYLLYTYDPPEVFDNVGTEAGPDGKNNRAGRLTRVTADASTNFTTAVPDSEVILVGKNSTWDNFDGFANSTFNPDVPEAGILPDGSYQQDILVADSESHTVGGLAFGPDGALYLTNGDGASYNRPDPRAARTLDIDSLSGKVLRIDPITGAGLTDNPFYDGDPNSNRSKVYQSGLRNPFRITVNEDNGELYIGDVGLSSWEEINNAEPGANFGWPFFEGGDGESLRTGAYENSPEAIAFYNSGQPVEASLRAFSHSATGINAIVLGDIYTGDAYPDRYKGDLFFNDLGQGIVRNVSLNASGEVTDIETFTTGANVVVHIEQGPDGTLYYTDLDDGEIGRWVFDEAEPGQEGFRPNAIPPLALPSQFGPDLVPRGRQQPADLPDFFLSR